MHIAHISDLHFSKISKGLSQFFSKAWIGNMNLLLNRNYDYSPTRPYAFIHLLKKEKITDVIISGDLTTTSSKEEFALAKEFIDCIQKAGVNFYSIPGNHDHYTRFAYRHQIFYQYFPKQHSSDFSYNLAKHGVTATKLSSHWWMILMDTTLATPLTSSNGYFSHQTETSLRHLLQEIPSTDKILLVNHFPFFQHDHPKRRLKRGLVLQQIIQEHPNIQLYLHGHTHRRCIADLRVNGLPIILDSGSTAYRYGSWNLLQLTENTCHLKVFGWENSNWSEIENHMFSWSNK